MSDKMFHIAVVHAELHNLKLMLEQLQTVLISAKRSNDRIIISLDQFIKSLDASQTKPTHKGVSENGNNS